MVILLSFYVTIIADSKDGNTFGMKRLAKKGQLKTENTGY